MEKQSGHVFYLPDNNNTITEADIAKVTLRITVNAATNFSRRNEQLNIEIKNQNFLATYTPREGRSDLLRIGRPAMELLGLKAGGRLKFTKVGNLYKIESI